MKKIISLCLGLLAYTGFAQGDMTTGSIKGMLESVQGQTLQLAGAFSEEQMDWRPAEGIRSVGETILHTAAANYYIAMKMGYAPPEDVDFMSMETIKGKDAIMEAFTKSAAFIKEKIAMEQPDSLGEEVDLGFMKLNRLSALLVVLEHNGEHKGQLIAYARSNGVVPPWSNPN